MMSAKEGAGGQPTLTVVVLTFNETLHIERCIQSALKVANEIIVVDSFSSDDTVEKAQRSGARVVQNAWTNHATQMNWALDNTDIATDWVMRLDADEILDDRLIASIRREMATAPEAVGGFAVNRRIRFMGSDIRHGGMSPMWITRLWRAGRARCEARWMDEHMVIHRGRVENLDGLLIDDNLNSLTWWIQKHNQYASREAVDLLGRHQTEREDRFSDIHLNRQARLKRWVKKNLYARLPLGVRPWLYFIYRVFFRFGFLDGGRGMIFHTLQGLWYRLLVDAKVKEIELCMAQEGCNSHIAIEKVLNIQLPTHTAQTGT